MSISKIPVFGNLFIRLRDKLLQHPESFTEKYYKKFRRDQHSYHLHTH